MPTRPRLAPRRRALTCAGLLLALLLSLSAEGKPRLLPDDGGGQGETRTSLSLQLAAAAGAAAISVPAALTLGAWVGTLSNNLLLAALPSLLVAAAVPAVMVTWAAWAVGNWNAPGSHRFQPAVWVTAAVNVLALVLAGFMGLSATAPTSLVLFTLADALLLAGASVGTMRLTAPLPPPAQAQPSQASLPRAPFLPLASYAF